MKSIEAQVIHDEQEDEDAGSNTNAQAQYIDERIVPISQKIPAGYK
jgi:hypothetical protein